MNKDNWLRINDQSQDLVANKEEKVPESSYGNQQRGEGAGDGFRDRYKEAKQSCPLIRGRTTLPFD